MKRSIVQHGSSSLTITLPSKWVEKFNLKKGDDLEVAEAGTDLIISTKKDGSVSKKIVVTTDSGMFTKNNLSHLYQLGYDEVEILYEDKETLSQIKSRLPDCIGFEIIDQKPNTIYIKAIATTLDSEFDTLLRKSFMITNDMAKSILEILESGDYKKLSEIREMESLNNRFTDVCIRILNKRGYKDSRRTMQVYEIVKNIERIADEFKYICDVLINFNGKLDKKMISCFKETLDYYLAFYNMFYKFDKNLKTKIYNERKSLVKKFTGELALSKGAQSILLHNLINIIQKSYDGAGGYFALSL